MPEDGHQCPVKNIVTEKARKVKNQDALLWYIAASSSGLVHMKGHYTAYSSDPNYIHRHKHLMSW